MRHLKSSLLALAASLAVVACGGGSSADTTPRSSINSVKVFGDSLQDSGTFGYKFTVQSPDNLIYPERVAASYGQTLCNFFTFTGTTFAPNAKAGCTNFAIGGGRIIYTGAGASAQNPMNVPVQLATYAALGSYSTTDLVIVDGGANDAADVAGAFIALQSGDTTQYPALLGNLLPAATVGAALLSGDPTQIAQLGGAYMKALADKFAASIQANVLDKGATHVVVMNIPDITLTPRFQMVLQSITAAKSAAAAQLVQDSIRGWVSAYNSEIVAKLGANDGVVVIDFYSALQDQVAHPAQFGLTNATTPACPVTGVGSDHLPTYDFPSCTSTALAANPPAGASGQWWNTYGFADSFHPTPYGHQLVQQLISKSLAIKGWL